MKLVSKNEAMSIMLYKIPKDKIANEAALERTYGAMTYYLSTLATAFSQPGDDNPESPDTSYLQNISEENSSRRKDHRELENRRRLLLAYL